MPEMPSTAMAGAVNQPDAGGAGAPPVPAPAGIPSVAAPAPAAGAQNPAVDQLLASLQPPQESPFKQAMRKALPLIAAAFAAKQGGNSLGAFTGAWQQGEMARQDKADKEAQRKERIAIAIKDIKANDMALRKQQFAEQKEANLEKAKLDAAKEKELHDIATHSLDAASKGGLFKTLNAMVDHGEDVDGYLNSTKLGTSPDSPALADLVKKGYVFRDPSGHFAYATDAKDLEPLTKTMTNPDGQYKYTINRDTGQIDPESWEYLGESNKPPPDPLAAALRQARVDSIREQKGDAEMVASAISGIDEDGNEVPVTQPPDMSRLYGKSLAVRAALARRGFDLASATKDWQATTRMIQSSNSPQQLRLRQAISTASQSLDVIDKLASQWHGGSFPPLNSASLIAAKNGLYGKETAEVARQLSGQITDVVSELGQVYQGGYSPTDQALGLAKENLAAEWDEAVLHSMTKLARQNLKIRENSILWAVPAGASPNNPYYHQQNPDDPFGLGLTPPKQEPTGAR